MSNDQAFVLPPPGGPSIVNIIEHHFNNAVRQDIYMFTAASTPGQNVLHVTFFGPVGLQYDDQKDMSYKAVRDSDIAREMRREFPGVTLTRSPIYVQNNYGPFGYATGKSRAGDTCLYGWQQIRSNATAQSAFQNRGTVQVRLRLCDAHATEQQLLGVMYGYTIVGTFPAGGWNPYDAPPRVDATLGRPENPIYPNVPSNSAAQLPPAFQPAGTVAAPVTRRQAVGRPATTVQPAAVVRPIGPVVPLPTPGQPVSRQSAVIVPGPGCVAGTEDAATCR